MNREEVFRIIKIISKSEVVINGGDNDYVREGNEYEVYVEGNEIVDPFSNENLGTLDFIKDTLTATYVSNKFSILKKIDTVVEREPSQIEKAFTMNFLQAKTTTRKIAASLNVFEDEITGYGIDADQMIPEIKVGDYVREKK